MPTPLDTLFSALRASRRPSSVPEEETIAVSDTVAAAASAYEAVRNTLEYDDEHLMRRNAIRRILRRRIEEEASRPLASDSLRELIWARYLPNKKVPEAMIGTIAAVFEKYRPLFAAARADKRRSEFLFDWILDVVSTEVEYVLEPPVVDEALASIAYRELKKRMVWANPQVAEEDRDLQLYAAVHRAIVRSNLPTLRFRLFTLYYPAWPKAQPGDAVVQDVAAQLLTVVDAIERQLRHKAADQMYRVARQHSVVFHVFRDAASEEGNEFAEALERGDMDAVDKAVTKMTERRYDRFRKRLFRSVLRAVLFLFVTKMFLALVVEFPYEQVVLKETNLTPLLVNIFVPPLILALVGTSVRIPEKRNTKKILDEVHAILGTGKDFSVVLKPVGAWARGAGGIAFRLVYALLSVGTIGALAWGMSQFGFNKLSVTIFVFFLSLVLFMGLKIRAGTKDLVIVETGGGPIGVLADILFLPIVRAGRWLSLRIPKVNVFLFFFDFLVEAPFKAAIRLFESWIAFMREKKEEI